MYSSRRIKDRLFIAFIASISILSLVPLFHIVVTIAVNGVQVIAKAGLRFFTDTPPAPLSRDVGGIAPALFGSFYITLVSLPITVALALLASILSTEFPSNIISRAVDVLSRSLASVPTIVVSMVVYTTVVVPMRGFSALAGVIALSLISLPYAYTAFSTALRSVPQIYREAAYSIGMNRWRTVGRILLPVSRRIIATGILMVFARAMGETAALLFTVGRYRMGVNIDIRAPTDAIPLLIFDFITTPFKSYHEIAWGAALVLLATYLAIFVSVKIAVKEVRL